MNENLAFSVLEFCARHSISRSTFYNEVNARRLQVMKVGRRTLVSVEAAAEWRKSAERANDGEAGKVNHDRDG